MSYRRALGEVIPERLAYWYLFRRKFPMELTQLKELYDAINKPVRLWRWHNKTDEKSNQVFALIKFLENFGQEDTPDFLVSKEKI